MRSSLRHPFKAFTVVLVSLVCLVPPQALAGPRPANDAAGCKAAAQDFYNWYLRSAKDGWRDAIKLKKEAFDPTLLSLLQKDEEQEDKTGEEGAFDFDPFLNSQDPYHRYDVREAKITNGICMANVYGVSPHKKDAKPDVVAEMVFQNDHWVFSNFHYGKDETHSDLNLLSILKYQ